MTLRARPSVRVVHIVIPAHDEEDLIERCLGAVIAAMDTASTVGVLARCTVVLDHCDDRTAALAAPFLLDPRLQVVRTRARNVGAARALGVPSPDDLPPGVDPEQVWLMSTDADTVVPQDWVLDHLVLADEHDLVIGAVHPEAAGLTPALVRAWVTRPRGLAEHVEVHGANLGLRLSTYRAAGGFPPLAEHEDVELVRAVRSRGDPSWCQATTVVTSSRLQGRVAGGFSGFLRSLAAGAP